MTKIINFFAGPGAGKSTCAADLFAEMKWQGYSVELINEAAKELVWEGHYNILQDQLYVSAQQNRRIVRLMGQVEYIITDSPLLLFLAYIPDTYPRSFHKMVTDLWGTYDNCNYFIDRTKPYDPNGRNQDENGAKEIDQKLLNILIDHNEQFTRLPADRNTKHAVIQHLGLS